MKEEYGQQPLNSAEGGLDPHLAYPAMLQAGYVPGLGPDGATAPPPPHLSPEASTFLTIMAMAYSHSPGTPQHTLAEMFRPLMDMALSIQGEGAVAGAGGATVTTEPQGGAATPATEQEAEIIPQAAGEGRRSGKARQTRGSGGRRGRGRGRPPAQGALHAVR